MMENFIYLVFWMDQKKLKKNMLVSLLSQQDEKSNNVIDFKWIWRTKIPKMFWAVGLPECYGAIVFVPWENWIPKTDWHNLNAQYVPAGATYPVLCLMSFSLFIVCCHFLRFQFSYAIVLYAGCNDKKRQLNNVRKRGTATEMTR